MQTNLSSKIIMKRGQTSLSGDSDTSKGAKPTKENEGIRKLKPSLIPRRKTNTCKVSTKETPVSLPKIFVKKPHNGHKNVQRVQHLNIDQDIYPGIHSPPKSVTTARPIPTLQHIYREDLSNETFTDWFLESVSEYRDIPEQFIDLNTASVETPKSEADSSITVSLAENNELNPLNNLPDIFNISPTVINYKSTNENVQDWLYSKLDYPTRDNESGYQSMSKPSQNNFSSKSKNSFSPKIFGDDKFYIFQNTLESNLQKAVYEETNSDIAKPIKYPSSPNPRRKLEHKENHPISSYVDYPSEILQKTTNFDANGCEIKNSGLGANSELHDDLSSQCTLDLGNEYNIPAENDSEWTKLQCSQHNTTVEKSSKISNFVDESWQFSFCEDKNDTKCFKNPNKNSYHDYYYHYCWRKEVAKKNKAVQELWDGKGRSILIGKSPNQSKMTSYKSLRCRCNSIDDTAKETIFSPCDNPDRKISDHIQDNIKVFENKITSAMFNLDSVKIDDSVTQDAYTQMIITCNNAETTTRFSPTLHTDFMKVQTSDNFDLSYGVDEEIQASPVSSIRRVSTGFVVQDRLLQDAKSSVVTAVSTDVNTENRDCSTAPSLYLRHLEDVALGISTSNLVNQVSFNGEAYQTQGSFGAAFHPECSTICTNTDIELKAQSTKTDSSFELQFEPKHALNKNDCYAQYSISRKSNQLSNNSGHSARIGHSRLLSVRNLGGSLCESPQIQATSSFDRTIETTKEQSVSAAQFNSINELGIRRTSNVVQTTLDTGEKDELKPFMKEMTCKSKSKEDLSKIQQNLVISSNLNAAKWIKGCVTESRKVTAKPLGVVSTVSAMNICPTKDKTKPIEKPKITSEPSDCKRVTVDNITSGIDTSIQAVAELLTCPNCSLRIADKLDDQGTTKNLLVTNILLLILEPNCIPLCPVNVPLLRNCLSF
ncbi:unnamed protein product [Euphydryas editha]|uniref:Uncharacterized protein n=1 Tax=Euphydryas editha TaxID=104508 RepID=A0AAU9V8G8_EUPED|nr:unnamed protein product [Euphydryas editha]